MDADDFVKYVAEMSLLTFKPVLYACNVDEGTAAEGNAFVDSIRPIASAEGAELLVISAKMSQGPWSPTSAGPIYFWLQGLGLSRKLGRFFPLQAASHVPMQNNYHRRRLIPEFDPPTRAQ